MKLTIGKSCLVEALVKLLPKKRLSEITVSELVEKAGVNRSTFYRNFKTIPDVLKEYFATYIRKTMDVCKEGSSAIAFFTELASNYYANKDELLSILRPESETAMSEVYWDYLFNNDERDYRLAFYSGGMNLLLLAYYHFKFQESPRELQQKIKELIIYDYPIMFFHNRHSKADK